MHKGRRVYVPGCSPEHGSQWVNAADFCDNRQSLQHVPNSKGVNNPTAGSEAAVMLKKALVLNEQGKEEVCKTLD